MNFQSITNNKELSFKQTFGVLMKKLSNNFNYQFGEGQLDEYYEVLSDNMNKDQLLYAFKHIRNNWRPSFGVKFPFPADFLEVIKKNNPAQNSPEENFEEYFSKLKKGVSAGSVSAIGDNVFKMVVKHQGGIFNLRTWTLNDWKYNKERMLKEYLSLIKRIQWENKREQISGCMNMNAITAERKFIS